MKTKRPSFVPAVVCGLLLLIAVWHFGPVWLERLKNAPVEAQPWVAEEVPAMRAGGAGGEESTVMQLARAQAAAEMRPLLERRLERRNARVREAILIFKDLDAYRKFQARAGAAGFLVLADVEKLFAVRVRYAGLDAVQAEIFDHVADYVEIGANAYVDRPKPPVVEERADGRQEPVRNTLLATLGVGAEQAGAWSAWGRGVTIAVLDSGVAADATFGSGRVRALDVGEGIAPGREDVDGHGTAVAALAAGAAEDARGVAPAAAILSIRVTAEDGRSDIFTVVKGIVAAADAGARVINISLGGYDTNVLLTRAIDYALAKGAVIVAAAGNDRLAQLAWPAADPRVISVGAVDARGRQASFSNSGETLKIVAPGYGVQTAWMGGTRVLFSGTSASAPVVAGALAAVISQRPELSAQQAWERLRVRTDDGGAPGADADYGAGALNLGWAMSGNLSRVDLAISSHWPERGVAGGSEAVAGAGAAVGRSGTAGTDGARVVEVVVQNRGGFGVAGATVEIEAGGVVSRQVLPWIEAGGSAVVKVPVGQERAASGTVAPLAGARSYGDGEWVLRTRVVGPGGVIDQVPGNNERVSVLAVPGK